MLHYYFYKMGKPPFPVLQESALTAEQYLFRRYKYEINQYNTTLSCLAKVSLMWLRHRQPSLRIAMLSLRSRSLLYQENLVRRKT